MSNRPSIRLAAASVMAVVLLPASACKKAETEKAGEAKAVDSPEGSSSAAGTAGASASGEAEAPATGGPPPGDLNKVGKVTFPTSCNPKVQAEFERGVGLLQLLFYNEARSVFEAVTKQDPNWRDRVLGLAMTLYPSAVGAAHAGGDGGRRAGGRPGPQGHRQSRSASRSHRHGPAVL